MFLKSRTIIENIVKKKRQQRTIDFKERLRKQREQLIKEQKRLKRRYKKSKKVKKIHKDTTLDLF